MYKITDYSRKQAKRLGVIVKPSTNSKKKIDVFRNGKRIATIGAKGYNDYPTYLSMEKSGKVPPGYAAERRKLYKLRHRGNLDKRNKNGYFANQILW
jgi:hypothetical protein